MKKITLILLLLTITFNSYAQLSEDFETQAPTGWTFMETETDDPGWIQTTTRANSGTASFYHSDDDILAESTSWMISPAYTVSADDKLSFFYNNNYSSFSVESGVWISTASGDPIANPTDFTEIFDIDANASEDLWALHEYDLSNFVGQIIYVAFKYRGDYADAVYIDDFSIAPPPSCPDTSALALDAVTNNTATISWTAGGGETAWEYVLQASGTGEPAAGGISTTTNPLTVSGLTGSTAYEIYLRAACDGGDFSAWVSTTFTTLCDVVTAPYSQDFENGGAIPDCMIMSGDEDWIFANSTSFSHIGNAGVIGNSSASGGYFAYVDDSGAHGLGTTLETPLVDVSAATTPTLFFYLLSNNEGYSNVSFSVDVYDGAAWNVGVFTSNTNTSDWEEITIDLSNLPISGPIKARFIVDEDNGTDYYDDVAIDDVRIMDMPSCFAPTDLDLDAVTDTTATISWTAGGTETAWEYVVEAYGSDEPSTGGESTTSNPLTISGLTADTAYDVYVRADCGAGDFSLWAKISFPTECGITDEALSQDFDTAANFDSNCWEVENGGDPNPWVLITDSGNTFWNLSFNTVAHDDYLYSPKFSVVDGVTDAFNFKGWNPNTTWPEVIDVLVVDASDNSLIATLATDLNLPEPDATTGEATTFTYDLSAYEGQDVRIAFYSSTTDQNVARLDDFTLDAFSTLGTATNTLEGFTLYPTIVKEELNFRSQNKVEAITVFNLLGQKVFSGAPNTNNSSINLSKLRPGVYVVKVSAEGKTGSYKIVKE